jgi:hypothetical protein
MAKYHSTKSTSNNVPKTPGPLRPLVMRVPKEDFRFTNAEYSELARAGGISLSNEQKLKLLTLAVFWIDDLLGQRDHVDSRR